MSAKNAVRAKLAYALIVASAFLLLTGWITSSGWGAFASSLGGALLLVGAVMLGSLSLINGVPLLIQFSSRSVEPIWDGEVFRPDGSDQKIRYSFDHRGEAWFVASDICCAIGTKPPDKSSLEGNSFPILLLNNNLCFSEKNVKTYLASLAMQNHAANQLLVSIKNNVLRKLDKQRDERRP